MKHFRNGIVGLGLLLASAGAYAAVSVTVNGTSYSIPQTNERGWGANVTAWIQAASQHLLQKTGGTFTLSADVDFGASYGLKSAYFSTRTASPSTAGTFRLANLDTIGWRNAANSANLLLSVNASDQLTFNGNPIFGTSALTASRAVETNASGVIITSAYAPATNANTASSVVARDGSGNFSAGTISAALSGNASTASALAANPSDCSSGQKATGIDASGNLTCSEVALASDVSGTLPVGNGGTGQTTATAAFNALDPLTTKGDIAVHDGTNSVRKAVGTDGQVLVADSTQTEGVKWGTVQGGINYLSGSDSDFNATVGNWVAYADAAGAAPVDGTGGSPAITCDRTTSDPLRGAGSLLITKDAANRQGEGCAVGFSIDRADLGKSLTVSFDYEIASGTYDAGSDTTDPDLTVWVYGPTDGTPVLTQLAPAKILGATVGVQMPFKGRFQTAASGVAYRLILHEAKSGTSAYTLKTDNISISPATKNVGPPVSDWITWTPTGSWNTNTTYTGLYRRDGDTAHYQVRVALSGAPNAAELNVNLPSGHVLDANKVTATAANSTPLFGYGHAQDAGTRAYNIQVGYSSTTAVNIRDDNSATDNGVDADSPFSFNSGDFLVVNFSIPISGWSSNGTAVEQDTRRMSVDYYGTATGTLNTSWNVVTFPTKGEDTHSAYSSGTVTMPYAASCSVSAHIDVTGTYAVNGYVGVGLFVNGVEKRVAYSTSASASQTEAESTLSLASYKFAAGDAVTIRSRTSATSAAWTASNHFSMICVPQSGGVQPGDTVAIRYTNSASTVVANNSATVVPFPTMTFDTHGAYNTSTGVFTAPIAGKYRVASAITYVTGGTPATTTFFSLLAYKNGAAYSQLGRVLGSGGANQPGVMGSDTIPLNAGDTLAIYAFQANGGTYALVADGVYNHLAIERIGD